ncbi:MAG: hypothetical protein HGA54_09465 [Actinobacteria bacterium]|nr:hypothetical protein [Actinomycetota bacterium]
MKKMTLVKAMLDLVMVVLYMQLMFYYDMSPLFHEIAGIGVGLLFAVHVALNVKPVKKLLKSAFEGRCTPARLVLLCSDIVLPFGMVAVIGTGMLIATELYLAPGWELAIVVHNVASWICLAILLVHTALHFKYLVAIANQLVRSSNAQKVASCLGAAALVLGLLSVNASVGTASAGTVVSQTTNEVFLTEELTDEVAATVSQTSYVEEEEESTTVAQATPTTDDTSSDDSGDIYCTACHRHCLLTNLQCARGEQFLS